MKMTAYSEHKFTIRLVEQKTANNQLKIVWKIVIQRRWLQTIG